MTERIYPTLTSYSLPVEEFAQFAIDGFVKGKFETSTTIMHGKLIKRKSTSK